MFLLLLGPVAFSRLDGIATALATVALVTIVNRPRLAATLISAAAWIKVTHGAWMLPLLIVSRRKTHKVFVPAAAITLMVIGVTSALGGAPRLFIFAGGQSDRALQSESVLATPFQVLYLIGRHSAPHFDAEINV